MIPVALKQFETDLRAAADNLRANSDLLDYAAQGAQVGGVTDKC